MEYEQLRVTGYWIRTKHAGVIELDFEAKGHQRNFEKMGSGPLLISKRNGLITLQKESFIRKGSRRCDAVESFDGAERSKPNR
jgi:hypothetical protein